VCDSLGDIKALAFLKTSLFQMAEKIFKNCDSTMPDDDEE